MYLFLDFQETKKILRFKGIKEETSNERELAKDIVLEKKEAKKHFKRAEKAEYEKVKPKFSCISYQTVVWEESRNDMWNLE